MRKRKPYNFADEMIAKGRKKCGADEISYRVVYIPLVIFFCGFVVFLVAAIIAAFPSFLFFVCTLVALISGSFAVFIIYCIWSERKKKRQIQPERDRFNKYAPVIFTRNIRSVNQIAAAVGETAQTVVEELLCMRKEDYLGDFAKRDVMFEEELTKYGYLRLDDKDYKPLSHEETESTNDTLKCPVCGANSETRICEYCSAFIKPGL